MDEDDISVWWDDALAANQMTGGWDLLFLPMAETSIMFLDPSIVLASTLGFPKLGSMESDPGFSDLSELCSCA